MNLIFYFSGLLFEDLQLVLYYFYVHHVWLGPQILD